MRSSHFTLDFLVIRPSNSGETRGKVDPPLQELRVGTGIMEFRQTPGGRVSSPTWFCSCLRTIQMVGVFGARKAVCFGPLEWDQRLKILDCSDSLG